MRGDFDNANGAPYAPLELLMMELFRTISPNGGSISATTDTKGVVALRRLALRAVRPPLRAALLHEHAAYRHQLRSRLWNEPERFEPERYLSVPTSADVDEVKCKQIGLPRCAFDITTLAVSDGRKTCITNSGFGTVFAVTDGKPDPAATTLTSRRSALAIGAAPASK